MPWQVLIAHANGEEQLAEELAGPIRDIGYEVAHQGTVLVGESVVGEASKVLNAGGPVVLCGTIKALGTKWARQIVQAARRNNDRVRIFCVQMEEEADVEALAFDDTIAYHWQDSHKAVHDLLTALQKYYPLDPVAAEAVRADDIEQRYRTLALETCDIIDLANLPENDRHLAMRRLELRRLYVALRVQVEQASGAEINEDSMVVLELRRNMRRNKGIKDKHENDTDDSVNKRVPLGQRLASARRLVVLGDPGAGKTTLVRWIATAYLLRLKNDPDWKDLPDVESLPEFDWLPIIVRCRDLDQSCLTGALEDILRHTLRKSELRDEQVVALVRLLRTKLERGEALLLLDGLDEITDPAMRVRFCEQLERVHVAYPQAPIIATSRIVGYREMGFRIGRGFEHVTVADLSREDKDDFARRWCAVTELPERQATATIELIRDIHSTDRIERLTVNPMLLTTMALVKRKVGKLPSRRADLYWDAVEMLLNWRREVDEPLDHHEAIPQLEYIAYAMCDRGVQQFREDEIIALFEQMREEYPQVHAIHAHSSAKFLRLLERRTGILIEAGYIRHNGRPVPVFEFRHLTFQEYLAGLALVDGIFPGRDRNRNLAENVAPLAGRTSKFNGEVVVTEHWREALRLCVTTCNNDDVDSVLLAILTPLPDEDPATTTRPRAVLATQCLADEPNVSEEIAEFILKVFVDLFGADDRGHDFLLPANSAAIEVAASRWNDFLRRLLLMDFYCQHEEAAFADHRIIDAYLYGLVTSASVITDDSFVDEWIERQIARIVSGDVAEAIEAALGIAVMRANDKIQVVSGLYEALLSMLTRGPAATQAAILALRWLNFSSLSWKKWTPSPQELENLISIVIDPSSNPLAVRFLLNILSYEQRTAIVASSKEQLNIEVDVLRENILKLSYETKDMLFDETPVDLFCEGRSIQKILKKIACESSGGPNIVEMLQSHVRENVQICDEVRTSISNHMSILRGILANSLNKSADTLNIEPVDMSRKLPLIYGDYRTSYMYPSEPIVVESVNQAANRLNLPVDEIRSRYEALARRFGLKLAWQPQPNADEGEPQTE